MGGFLQEEEFIRSDAKCFADVFFDILRRRQHGIDQFIERTAAGCHAKGEHAREGGIFIG